MRKTVCAICGKKGKTGAPEGEPTACPGCAMFAGLSDAVGRAIGEREHLTESEGLYHSSVSRTPDCSYIRDEGPTVDIGARRVFCACPECECYRATETDHREPLLPDVPEDCLA